MACMTHNCHNCKHEWFDNFSGGACPRCWSTNVGHAYDEGSDDDPDDGCYHDTDIWVED